jgi:hypothetical protein
MNGSSSDTVALTVQLRSLLAQHGPLTAQQLQTATGKSQPSVSLALGKLGQDVCKMGAARSTRYALTQPILGLDARQPIHLATPHADQGRFGALTLLAGEQVFAQGPRKSEWLTVGALPWWLSSLRPQGFLGRQFTRLRPDFAPDPDRWSVSQVLYIAANHFSDPPGAFSLGTHGQPSDMALASQVITQAGRSDAFDQLADALVQGLPTGSSAGGEQPKFICRVRDEADALPADRQVIVKYSPPRGTPFGERWHDLLHLEHLANQVLRDQGIASAQTEVVQTPRRTFLQSTRFDRDGVSGKRHVVAASALHDAFVRAPRRHWAASCQALVAQKMLAPEHLASVASVYCFGQFIGNTDMHFGNLSFFVDDVTRPVLLPTPVYDMLPMKWRPGIHDGALDLTPLQSPVPLDGFDAQALQSRQWAMDFWQRAAGLPELSPPFRALAGINAGRLISNFAML